jgi:hypothetical protein
MVLVLLSYALLLSFCLLAAAVSKADRDQEPNPRSCPWV